MRRNIALFREILLEIESAESPNPDRSTPWYILNCSGQTHDVLQYHAKMLTEQNFLYEDRVILGTIDKLSSNVVKYASDAMTNSGHEFLDNVRDPDIWAKARERAKGVASVGLSLVWELAKAEIKKKLLLP